MRTQMGDLLRGQTGVGQDALGILSRLLWCRALLDRVSLAAAGHRANRLQGPALWGLVGVEGAVLQWRGSCASIAYSCTIVQLRHVVIGFTQAPRAALPMRVTTC